MSHQGTEFASKKDVLEDVLKRDIKQVGQFSPQSTAEEVAKVLASDIAGKIGEYNADKFFTWRYV
jgi:predicted AAA+ superfamily ATPase